MQYFWTGFRQRKKVHGRANSVQEKGGYHNNERPVKYSTSEEDAQTKRVDCKRKGENGAEELYVRVPYVHLHRISIDPSKGEYKCLQLRIFCSGPTQVLG